MKMKLNNLGKWRSYMQACGGHDSLTYKYLGEWKILQRQWTFHFLLQHNTKPDIDRIYQWRILVRYVLIKLYRYVLTSQKKWLDIE